MRVCRHCDNVRVVECKGIEHYLCPYNPDVDIEINELAPECQEFEEAYI